MGKRKENFVKYTKLTHMVHDYIDKNGTPDSTEWVMDFAEYVFNWQYNKDVK